MSTHQKTINIFISYDQNDEKLLWELEKHLSVLKNQGAISIWHRKKTVPGNTVNYVIYEQLKSASIILLLVSAYFLASHDSSQIEMKYVLEQHKTSQVQVIPIILRPCDWSHASFASLECLPTNRKPIKEWANQDLAWTNVAESIRRIVEDMSSRSTSQTKPSADTGPSTASPGQAHEKSYQPLSTSSDPVKLPDIPKQAQRGKLWLTLALPAFFLILLFTGSLLFLWKNASISTPEETLITFCNALQKQDYQTAYNTYTSGTKQIVSEQEATNDWSTNGQHGRIINCWVKGSETSGDYDHNMVMYLLADGTKIIYYYYLIQENGVWKIINGRGGEKAP